jgi:hypothetical protein
MIFHVIFLKLVYLKKEHQIYNHRISICLDFYFDFQIWCTIYIYILYYSKKNSLVKIHKYSPI